MALWICRGGRYGEREQDALDKGRAVIGWEEMPDLTTISSRDEMLATLNEVYPTAKEKTLQNWRNQLWAFAETAMVGDLVVLPLKTRSAIAFGRLTGNYRFDAEGAIKHFRAVDWLVKDAARQQFPKDLLFSFGAAQTVCQITRNHAERRVEQFLATGNPNGWSQDFSKSRINVDENSDLRDPETIDIQAYADDQLRRFIQEKFAGHDLARLVEGILKAKGYKTLNSPPGRDGGVDILAGLGELGFDAPRICVQVKSETAPLDVSVLRELQATITNFGAEHGLLVGWGGFKQSLENEAKRLFFRIRLWESKDLLENLFEVYTKLAPELRAELPLKPIWTIASPREDDDE